MNKRHPFHLCDPEAFSGTKRPNIITKDSPIALTAQEIPRALGATEPGTRDRPKYILITNHNITVLNDYGTTALFLTIHLDFL